MEKKLNLNQKISSKSVEANLNSNKHFQIRRRKTFLIDKKSRQYKKDTGKRNSLSSLGLSSFPRRKSSLILSLKDFRDIEEEIKCTILEMRRNCLWEIRRQSYDAFGIFEKRNSKTELEKELNNSPMHKFATKYLEDSYFDDKENIKKKFKSSKNLALKKKKYSSKKNIIKIKEIINNNDINNNLIDIKEINNNGEKRTFESSKILLKFNKSDKKRNILSDKFRFISRSGIIVDSMNENESDEDPDMDEYLINPENKFIFIYDTIITFGSLYSLIYIPYELAKYFCFCNSFNWFHIFINFFIDILFIIDLIMGFFRAFYTRDDEKLVKNNIKIIKNYITGYFTQDFITSVPINILYYCYCRKHPKEACFTYGKYDFIDHFILIRCLKSIKIFKISSRKKNQFVTELMEKLSDFPFLDNFLDLFVKIFYVIFGLHIISCIHIFIGRHVYPGWIYKNNFQDYSLSNLYMISLYYLITTMTTVGYGEIQLDSMMEIIFRIVLLAVGIVCYSWLISSISNGINKQSYASINYSNECAILENIRRAHRELPYKVYLEIKKYLEYKNFRQKIFDKDLLINSLPYSLKNALIFSMYNTPINYFHFFKGISNTNFLVETLSYLTPIEGKKNDLLIKENEIFEEIYFVLEGRLALEVPINMDNPEESTNKYISDEFLNFAFDFDYEANYNQVPQISNLNGSYLGDSVVHSTIDLRKSSFVSSMITKSKKRKKKPENNVYLKIHDIHKNEDFGDIYMFFGKRSPFALRVKTNKVKLYSIKKANFTELCEQYQNVFRRIHKRKKHNFKIIKNILIKTISKFCDTKGIKIKEIYKHNIDKAMKEYHRELIPDILKSSNHNEIDEQVNKTIKEFDSEIQVLASGIGSSKKKKSGKLLKLLTTANKDNMKNKEVNLYNGHIKGTTIFKGKKSSFFDDFKIPNNTKKIHYTGSINGNKKFFFKKSGKKKKYLIKKKPKKKNIKTIIKSNVSTNINLKGIDFNFSESEESLQTVRINENKNNESIESGPKTIKILPQSLINLLRTKLKFQQLLNEKESSSYINDQFFISINNNKNLINNNSNNINSNFNSNFNNFISINSEKAEKMNSSGIKKKNMSSSFFTFNKFINSPKKGEKEIYYKNSKNERSSSSNRVIDRNKVSIRDSVSPFTSKMFSKINKDSNNNVFLYNQYNNFKKCSITNNNILLKLDEDILKKNYSFNSESLISTSAESFQIERSYKNINQESGGLYIKEKKFQIDTIQFIKDYKNNKKSKFKRKNTRASVNFESRRRSLTNILSMENSIKTVKRRMTNYIKQNLKLIRGSIFGLKRKNSFTQKLKVKKTKKELSMNSIICSHNNSIYSSNISLNNNIKLVNKSFNDNIEGITLGKLNFNNDVSKLDFLKEVNYTKEKHDVNDKKSYKSFITYKTDKKKK